MVLHPYLMTCRFAALYSNDKLEPGDSLRAAKELLEKRREINVIFHALCFRSSQNQVIPPNYGTTQPDRAL